jgi:HlyD family secretion protein
VSVSATGTLEPVNQVDVGSELSGTIEKVLVDDNDLVAKGQVLATLDTSRLVDQIANGEAVLALAQANQQQAEATVRETALKAGRLHRLYAISSGGYPAKADIDAADAALDRARAGVASAKAGVKQAAAALNTGRTNLSKAVIRSPVGGVVLARKIEPGQTVAASLQAPVLFTLAEDMRRMELHVDVDEADVSQVREGQQASFTVDAYPGRDYPAQVTRVGLGSETKEGVVTYTGVLAVDNADLTLRPGMTASAEITSERRTNVLLVPEAALRFRPADSRPGDSATLANALTPRMPRMGSAPRKRSTDPNAQQVWVLRDGEPVMVEVKVGATNGRETEVSGKGLAPGMAVITGTNGNGS